MRADLSDPSDVYRRRMAERSDRVAVLCRRDNLLSNLRLAVFFAGLALAWPVLAAGGNAWLWLLLPLAVFVAAVVAHERVVRQRTHAERAVRYYDRGLARLDDRWAGEGAGGEAFLDPRHPYAGDLDLFGKGSLFQLLCVARTRTGERTLARWLCEPAGADEVRRRQEAVEELRPRLDLREELALLGQDVGEGVDPDELTRWAAAEPVLTARWPVLVAGLLAVSNLVTLGLWIREMAQAYFTSTPAPDASFFTGSGPFWLSALASMGFAMIFRARVHRVLHAVDRPEHELELLAEILSRLERESFSSPRLRELRAELDADGDPPSRRIARLARLVQIDQSRHNQIFSPFAALMLLGMQLAFALERWRSTSGPAVRRWLEAVGEIEALSSFAGHAFEHPDDCFPEIVDGAPQIDGRGLGHPLIPEDRCVRNDVALGQDVALLLVSGSNMSGKSTLLRTVGVNTVLALAGAPARAVSLRVSPFAIGASMRIVDSLQEGTSHFYAELKRLRSIVDLTEGPRPVLFLLDEILHGTNSHDRRVGAEALIRGLVQRGATGLVTTHDLALTDIVSQLGPRAVNVHFVDHLEGDRIAFDYRLRQGVVQKSNALALMRAVGLEL